MRETLLYMGVTRLSMSHEAAAPTAMQNKISQRLRQATCNRFVSRCFSGWSMANVPGWGTVSAYGSTSTNDDITFSTRNAEGQSYGKEVRTNRSRRILTDGYDTVLFQLPRECSGEKSRRLKRRQH